MELNYMWDPFTWTKGDGGGGSGIRNVVEGEKLGTCYQKRYVITSTRNLIFWVISLNFDEQVQ